MMYWVIEKEIQNLDLFFVARKTSSLNLFLTLLQRP